MAPTGRGTGGSGPVEVGISGRWGSQPLELPADIPSPGTGGEGRRGLYAPEAYTYRPGSNGRRDRGALPDRTALRGSPEARPQDGLSPRQQRGVGNPCCRGGGAGRNA